MHFSSRTLPSSLLALVLVACGGGDDSSSGLTAAPTTDDDTDATPQTTTDADPTTAPVDPTTEPVDPTTGSAVDPCDACDEHASCQGDECVCDDGYDGDGQTCADVDECAGNNDCAVDATCSNTPGGYDCACDDGYKGNGFNCEDIDECTEDLDMCSANADCANQDGAYKCSCKDGFIGDGFTCNGSKQFGAPCEFGEDCASGLCIAGGFDMCTIACDQNSANDCGDQGVTGLCVQTAVDMFVCAGDATFGADKDDEVLKNGDTVKRDFQTKTDADLFLVQVAVPGNYVVIATPDPDDDIQLEFHNADASELGTLNMFGDGQAESGVVMSQPGVFFVVARNIGISNGSYTIEVSLQ